MEAIPIYISNAIGWYPTFNLNASLMAMITALLSIHYIFKHISLDSYWFGLSMKERILRVTLSNLLVLVGVFINYFNPNTTDKLGIRTLLTNGIIVLVIYGMS